MVTPCGLPEKALALSHCAALTMFYSVLFGDRCACPPCVVDPSFADKNLVPCADCPITEAIMRAVGKPECLAFNNLENGDRFAAEG